VYGNVGSVYNAYTQLRQFTENTDTEHTYQVGDQILITQSDGGALKPILTGLHTIVEIVDDWTVVIDLPFSAVGTGATVGGSTVFADNRKTIERDMVTKSATVFNGALGHVEFLTLSGSNLVTTGLSTTKRLLTNLPTSGFSVTPTQIVKVNVANNFTTDAYYLYFQNDTGGLFRKAIGTSSSEAIRQFEVGATVTGLTMVTGSIPLLVSSTTTSYSFWITDVGSEQMSAKYKMQIDRRCAINDTEMIFLDRKGSLASFAFQARNKVQTQVERNGYTSRLGGVDTDLEKWTYNTIDGGDMVSAVSLNEEITLNTYWMTDEQSVYFNELVSSPYTLLKWEGVWIKVRVVDTSFTTDRTKDETLVKKQITVKPSNQININA
jgi:hypothetical protein